MKSNTNRTLVKRNRRTATGLFLGTLAVLGSGLIFINIPLFTDQVFPPWVFLLQIGVLPVAFVMTIISVRMTNLWARRPYPHQAIEDGAKGLSKKSVMYHYYHLPARHVLIAPQGIFAIVTRWHDGNFTVEDGKWKTQKNPISRLFSAMRMDGVGDPVHDAERAAKHVRELLQPIAPDAEVKPLVIFVDPRVEIDLVDELDVPILYADEKQKPNLTSYMRDLNKQTKQAGAAQSSSLPLTNEQIEAFEAATIK